MCGGTGTDKSKFLSNLICQDIKEWHKSKCGMLVLELVDEESYQGVTADLVNQKTTLKQEKQRLHKPGLSFWNKPAKEVINIMELAGKPQRNKSPQEIAQGVNKVGTNHLLSRKTVTFSLSEPHDFIPSLLASLEASISFTPPRRLTQNPKALNGADNRT